MIASVASHLGVGIYTPAEAAFYARVRTQTLNRWLFGTAQGESVVTPQLRPDGEKTVTFLDFIQALAIRAIRIQYRIPLTKIREAVQRAEDEFGQSYPLARKHTAYLLSDGARNGHGELVVRVGDDDRGKWIQVSGKKSGNLILHKIAELYLDDVSFGELGLAEEYTPWSGPEGRIFMNPHRSFGEPIVESCGYTAQTLWEANQIEGGLEAAARAYGVTRDDVALACKYYDHLMTPA